QPDYGRPRAEGFHVVGEERDDDAEPDQIDEDGDEQDRQHARAPYPMSDPAGRMPRMAKVAIQHVCRECGFRTAKWFGKCGGCGAFGSVEEEESRPPGRALSAVVPIDRVPLSPGRRDRTGIGELDRALGGGLVPGGVVLLAGDPGIGKSTRLVRGLG